MKRSVSYLMSVVLLVTLVMCRSDAQVLYTLTVEKSGDGTGTVTGNGIDCRLDCTEQYGDGTPVVLQAQEDLDSIFVQWLINGQPASGEITITQDLTVTAVFEKKPDSDNDGLPDDWEQQIIDADPNDSITTIQDVLPGDDFDGDGLTNEEEFWNQTDPTSPTKWFLEIIPMDVSGTQTISEVQRLVSFRMDVQLRFQHNNQPAELVRDVTIIADGGGMFASTAQIGSVQRDPNFPGQITATTNADGQFSIEMQGTQPGRIAFSVEPEDSIGEETENLVASYSFDGHANDESGNNHHGINHNAVLNASGKVNTAADFGSPANSWYVQVPNSPHLHFGQDDLTLSMWLFPTSFVGTGSSLSIRVLSSNNIWPSQEAFWVLDLLSTGKIYLLMGEGNAYGGGMDTAVSDGSIPLHAWTHLTIVVDRQQAQVRYYFNGELESEQPIDPAFDGNLNPDSPLYIGSNWNYFSGKIDEFKIYDRILSEREIKVLASGGERHVIDSISAPFLSAVWQGRQLDFSGADSVEIRIHDLAQTLAPTFYSSENPTWEIGGISFEHVTISKQGYLLFGQQSPLATTDIALQDAPDGLLAPFLDDLIMKPESRIYVNWDWLIEPCFTVQWCRMGHVSDPDARITFQIQLWQRSKQVRVVYDLLKNGSGTYADGHDAVIGFKYAADKVYAWTKPLSSFSALEVIDVSAPAVDVFALDVDQDRLNKADEELLGTDPDNWDSDFDGMSDGWENRYSSAGLNPLQPDASADADSDGYLNIIEYYLGTQPDDPDSPEYCEPDTDNDGMPDSWETTYGLDPNSADDALIDTDYDWYVNVLEYAIGGDPTDAAIQGTHPAEPEGGMSHATYP